MTLNRILRWARPIEELPAEAKLKTSFTAWQRALVDTVWRDSVIEVREQRSRSYLRLEESERDFVARVKMAAREKRDEEFDVIEAKYEKKRPLRLKRRSQRRRGAVDRVKDQAKDANPVRYFLGAAALGAVLGKSLLTQSTVISQRPRRRGRGR